MNYEDTLYDLAQSRPELSVMTAENRAIIRGLPERFGDRFIDVGIAEMTLIGSAAGLALRGRVPIVHALATFLVFRAYEFVRDDIGIAHLPVKLMGFVPGFQSEANGPTHQAIEDIALMRTIPGMRVWCPADMTELLAGLPEMVDDPHPWYVRLATREIGRPLRVPDRLGHARVYGNGRDAALVTYGPLLDSALDAQARLADQGIHARVVHAPTIVPLDTKTIDTVAQDCAHMFVVEDHFKVGGLYAALCERFVGQGRLPCTLHSIALDGRWFKPLRWNDVLEHEGFTGEKLAHRCVSLVEKAG